MMVNETKHGDRYSDRRLSQSIILAALLISGTGVLAVVAFSGIDWYLPTLAFGTIAYLIWQRFLTRPSKKHRTSAESEERGMTNG